MRPAVPQGDESEQEAHACGGNTGARVHPDQSLAFASHGLTLLGSADIATPR